MANKGSNLGTNQSLNMGDFLVSPNGNYKAIMQDDGNFVVYQGATAIWASGLPRAGVQGPYHAIMQADGNFVVNGAGTVIWATNILGGFGTGPYYHAGMQNDGDFVVSEGSGLGATVLWAVNGPRGSSLATNQTLNMGAYLTSPNAVYKAIMQADGNFVVYQGATAIWASGVVPGAGNGPYRAVMQGDGNFVVYQGATAIWATNILGGFGTGPYYHAGMQNDGDFVVSEGGGAGATVLWAVNGPRGSTLANNQPLNGGAYLTSPNGKYRAMMQTDGNFVVAEVTGGSPIWASGVVPGVGNGPYRALMQADGNFVVSEITGAVVLWASGVVPGVGQGPYHAVMQDDGNFVVFGAGGTVIWAVNGPRGSTLANNQPLNMGAYLTSPNGNYRAIMQADGNFVVYQGTGGTAIWASGAAPAGIPGPYRAVMQADGNFVVSEVTGTVVLWASGIVPGAGNGPYHAVMQDDGNFVVYQGAGAGATAIWAVNGPRGSSLANNQTLNMGAYLTSPNGNYKAIMQNDGNFVIYQGTAGGTAIWASGVAPGVVSGPYRATMQNDGNFVVYQGTGGQAIWASGVVPGVGNGPYHAGMQNDGNFVVYQGTGRHAIWSINDIPYFYGNAGIPRGQNATEVGHRYINAGSLVFLTVDTTAVPGGDVALPGVRLNNRGQGFITISTLDESNASEPCGVPLSYLVVNRLSGTMGPLSYTTGTGAIPANADHVGINAAAAQPNSTILLTVDATSINESVHLPGLKVNNKGSGWFTVTTLGLGNAPSTGIRFNWMIVNGGSSALTGSSSAIPHGVHNIGSNSTAVSMPAAVFLTVDATSIPGTNDVALPGVKVNNHGDGWFTVTTEGNTNAPSTGVPFGWLVVQPPPRWEEYGPTALSGNCWTMAFDTTNPTWQVVYCGSTWGGVWKTVDGGQNWAPAWDQPQVGIYRLLVDPTTSGTIYALDFNMQVWISFDAGESWNPLPGSPPSLAQADTAFGAAMTLASDGTLWIASQGGLAKLPPPLIGSSWILDNPNPSSIACTDVVIGRDGTVYAAIQGDGVFRLLPNQTQWEAINTGETIVQKPMRLAVGQNTIVLNADQDIYTHSVSTTTWNDWVSRGQWCCGNGQGGYALSVGISPSDDNHFLAFGTGGWATFTGGATHFPDNDWGKQIFNDPSYIKCGNPPLPCDQLAVGQDDHQVVFFNDQCLGLATDNGPRFSSDGGRNWAETQAGPSRITVGPPISQFYNLKVSQPDQFGRVLVSGDVQDAGSSSIIGNQFGLPGGGGETGLSVPAAPVNSQDTTFNMPSATFHFYGVDTSPAGDPKNLLRNRFNVPGPYYVAPPGTGENAGSFPPEINEGLTSPTSVVDANGNVIGTDFPQNITAIATHPTAFDQVLVGLANGDVYRSVAGSQGVQFKLFTASSFGNTAVTSINFVTTSLAYAGYQNGGLIRLTDPFSSTFTIASQPTASTQAVVAVALDSQASPARLYMAHTDGVWVLAGNDGSLIDVIGPQTSGLGAQLASGSGLGIVGMALDSSHRFLYVATGVDASASVWRPISGSSGTVWRKSLDLGDSGAWNNFGTGFPDGVPITGLGVAPNQGLFISTRGRGVWWRRDLTG